MEINLITARKNNITNGEAVIIEQKGKQKDEAKITETIIPNFVAISHGWANANENELTGTENLDPISGFPALKGAPYRIRSPE